MWCVEAEGESALYGVVQFRFQLRDFASSEEGRGASKDWGFWSLVCFGSCGDLVACSQMLANVSLSRLGYKTPLQAAKVPNYEAIASVGVNGLMDPVEVGLACGSDTAHLSLRIGHVTW
ncbi:2,3-bisphosphoglycerate-independent phosphoglycerate mutase 1 [Spatholobus suberectus]|nr:2,3-bisphosphoglycerate-independent phosphoglycerate mutase 1 [Spatholobus suberectus]